MLCIFSSRAYSLSGGYHALRNIHPSTRSRRRIRPGQAARLPDQSRVPWLSERLDARSGAEFRTDPGSARTHDLRRGLQRPMRLGCAVFVSPLHNPVHLAKAISTLDQLSRGRIEVGIATGGKSRMFSAFEVDPASLVARFIEGLQLMKVCWTETRITFGGRYTAAARCGARSGHLGGAWRPKGCPVLKAHVLGST